MIVALVNFDLAVLILAAWVVLAVLTAPFIGRFLRGLHPTFDSQQRERVGLSPVLADAERRQTRIDRAQARRAA